jgi:hypothetical protein
MSPRRGRDAGRKEIKSQVPLRLGVAAVNSGSPLRLAIIAPLTEAGAYP